MMLSSIPDNQNDFDKIYDRLPTVRKEVLKLFLQGYGYKEIAEQMTNSESNVRGHLRQIRRNFGLVDGNNNNFECQNNLIKLFCNFRRDLVAFELRHDNVPLRSDELLDIKSITDDICLIQGLDYLNQQIHEN